MMMRVMLPIMTTKPHSRKAVAWRDGQFHCYLTRSQALKEELDNLGHWLSSQELHEKIIILVSRKDKNVVSI